MFNLPLEKDKNKVVEIASKIPLKPFVPKQGVKIETEEKKDGAASNEPLINEDD